MRLHNWVIVAVVAGCSVSFGAAQKEPQSGEAIYRQKCGGCHGLDGKSQTTMGKNWKMRDLTSVDVQKQTDRELTNPIFNGRGHMPAYQTILSNEQIQAVVGYLRDLSKKEEPPKQ
jgi:mono/diheme cytochrome c family protein